MEENVKTKPRRQQNPNRNRWNERIVQISRVTKVCKGGKKLSFRVVIVIGNENGKVGVGVGKADDVVNAIFNTLLSSLSRKASVNCCILIFCFIFG